MTDEEKKHYEDAVLAEKIQGLSNLTDERLKNIGESLKRIEDSNKTFATRADLDDTKKDFGETIKKIESGFAQHNVDDKKSFSGLDEKLDKNNKLIWMALGGITVASFIIQLIAPVILRFLNWG